MVKPGFFIHIIHTIIKSVNICIICAFDINMDYFQLLLLGRSGSMSYIMMLLPIKTGYIKVCKVSGADLNVSGHSHKQ